MMTPPLKLHIDWYTFVKFDLHDGNDSDLVPQQLRGHGPVEGARVEGRVHWHLGGVDDQVTTNIHHRLHRLRANAHSLRGHCHLNHQRKTLRLRWESKQPPHTPQNNNNSRQNKIHVKMKKDTVGWWCAALRVPIVDWSELPQSTIMVTSRRREQRTAIHKSDQW